MWLRLQGRARVTSLISAVWYHARFQKTSVRVLGAPRTEFFHSGSSPPPHPQNFPHPFLIPLSGFALPFAFFLHQKPILRAF